MTKLKYDQCVRGDVKISKTDEKKYKIKFKKISDFLVYQVWVDDKTVNENRNVLNQKAIDWVNTNFTNNKNISFTPTTVMELGNKKYVFVIINAYMNNKNEVVFSVSTKSINTESLANSRLPIGKFQNVRFDIDPTPTNVGNGLCIPTPCTCFNFPYGIQLDNSGLYYLPSTDTATTNNVPINGVSYPPALWDAVNGYSFCFCNPCYQGVQYNFNITNANITNIITNLPDIYCLLWYYSNYNDYASMAVPTNNTLFPKITLPLYNSNSNSCQVYGGLFVQGLLTNLTTNSPLYNNVVFGFNSDSVSYVSLSSLSTYPGTAGLSLVGLASSNQAGEITYSLIPPLLAGTSISNNTLYLPETALSTITIQASQPYFNGTISFQLLFSLNY